MNVLHEQILPDMTRAVAWVLRFCAYYLVAAHVADPLGVALRAWGLPV